MKKTIPGTIQSGKSIDYRVYDALFLWFSRSTSRRLWTLYNQGLSLRALARIPMVLKGFGTTPENDTEWTFGLGFNRGVDGLGLEMKHSISGTKIRIDVEKPVG